MAIATGVDPDREVASAEPERHRRVLATPVRGRQSGRERHSGAGRGVERVTESDFPRAPTVSSRGLAGDPVGQPPDGVVVGERPGDGSGLDRERVRRTALADGGGVLDVDLLDVLVGFEAVE